MTQQPGIKKVANFALNRDKQVERLGIDANVADYEIAINDEDRNVNILCSTGFYDKVAKPVFSSLAKGSTMSLNNISISCDHIDYNRDKTLCEYNRVLHIKLGGAGQFSIGKVTIHLHHTKRLVQMQGSVTMPDGCKAPVWFLNTFVRDKFANLAKSRKYDISAFNRLINQMVTLHKKSSNVSSNCAQCMRQFSANSRPTLCSSCMQMYHKTSCLLAHSSSCSRSIQSLTSNMSSQESASTIDTQPQKRQRLDSSTPTSSDISKRILNSSRSTSLITVCPSTVSVPIAPATSSSTPSASIPGVESAVSNIQCPPLPPVLGPSSTRACTAIVDSLTTSAPISSSLVSLSSQPTLNASAPSFTTGPGSHRRKNKTSINNTLTPENAKINFLNIELNAAKTKIAQLETTIADFEGTVKIQEEKIKILEKLQLTAVNETFLKNSQSASASSSFPNSCSSMSSENLCNYGRFPLPSCPHCLQSCSGHHQQHSCHHHSSPWSCHCQTRAKHNTSACSVNAEAISEIRGIISKLQDSIIDIVNDISEKDRKVEQNDVQETPSVDNSPPSFDNDRLSQADTINVIEADVHEAQEDQNNSIGIIDEFAPDDLQNISSVPCSLNSQVPTIQLS